MTILLADNALLTLAEATEFLNLGVLTLAQESLVNDCVNRVSSFIEEFVGRDIVETGTVEPPEAAVLRQGRPRGRRVEG